MVRRVETHLRGAPGTRPEGPLLFRRSWLPDRPARVVLLVHGYAEHSGRYDHVGTWLAERGYAVHAYDHRGHGRSEGLRCHVDRFEELLDDLGVVLEAVSGEHAERPVYLLGHSMGGLVVSRFVAERRPHVEAAVTSGAALALSPELSRGRALAARALRRVAPRLALGSGLDPHGLSRDAEVVRAYLEDPHVHRTMTVSLAAELLGAVEDVASRAFEVQVPMLLLHGEDDPLCPAEGSRAFHRGLHEARSALRIYPGLRHEILNEPEREAVLQDIHGWIETLAGAAADARAAVGEPSGAREGAP